MPVGKWYSIGGIPPTRCIWSLKGHFAVRIITPLGDTATLTIVGPGESFGELALLSAVATRSATVEALEPGTTFALHRLDFERVKRIHPEVDQVLITALSSQVHRLSEQLVEALYVPAERRVLRRLLDLAANYGSAAQSFTVPLTQEDVAGLAGTSRATVNKVLRDQERRGTLELGRGASSCLTPSRWPSRPAETPKLDGSRGAGRGCLKCRGFDTPCVANPNDRVVILPDADLTSSPGQLAHRQRS